LRYISLAGAVFEFVWLRRFRAYWLDSSWADNRIHHSHSLDSYTSHYRCCRSLVFHGEHVVGWNSVSRYRGVVRVEEALMKMQFVLKNGLKACFFD
jgi:hypothetical protein